MVYLSSRRSRPTQCSLCSCCSGALGAAQAEQPLQTRPELSESRQLRRMPLTGYLRLGLRECGRLRPTSPATRTKKWLLTSCSKMLSLMTAGTLEKTSHLKQPLPLPQQQQQPPPLQPHPQPPQSPRLPQPPQSKQQQLRSRKKPRTRRSPKKQPVTSPRRTRVALTKAAQPSTD